MDDGEPTEAELKYATAQVDKMLAMTNSPVRRSTRVVIVTPERLAELEAEVERLREACETERAIAKRLAAECVKWEARVGRMDIEVGWLREACTEFRSFCEGVARWQRVVWNPPDVDAAGMLKKLDAALGPQP